MFFLFSVQFKALQMNEKTKYLQFDELNKNLINFEMTKTVILNPDISYRQTCDTSNSFFTNLVLNRLTTVLLG